MSPRRRSVGRPRGGAADVRAKLIDAALAQFARTGIRASSLRAVAETAGVTPAMLHYYFGDKRQMTLAVIEERLLPAVAPLRSRVEKAGDTPAELVRAFVDGVGAMIAAHPWLPSLWVREVLCEGGALRDTLFKQVIPQLPQVLAKRFAAAQARGQLAAGLDPRLLVVSLVGLTLFPAAGAPIWRQAFDAQELDAEVLRRHTLALLDHGVETRQPRGGRKRS
jgi:TetR/AcrR family transcriptional regulator